MIRLYCFPYAGGGASIYYGWRNFFGNAQIEVIPVQFPGREEKSALLPKKDFSELSDWIIENYFLESPDEPYFIWGHSMGALLGYEVAMALARNGKKLPEALMLSAFVAPHLFQGTGGLSALEGDQLYEAVKSFDGFLTSQNLSSSLEDLSFKDKIITDLKNDFLVCETYRHKPENPLSIPLYVFGGLNDQLCPQKALQAWGAYTTGEFKLNMFIGGHFYLREQEINLFWSILNLINKLRVFKGHS